MLSKEQLSDYNVRGYIVAPDCLSANALANLRAEAEQTARDLSDPGRVTEQDGVTVRGLHGLHLRSDLMNKLCSHPRLLAMAKQLLGTDVYVHQFKLNVKAAFVGDMWEWHQDISTLPPRGRSAGAGIPHDGGTAGRRDGVQRAAAVDPRVAPGRIPHRDEERDRRVRRAEPVAEQHDREAALYGGRFRELLKRMVQKNGIAACKGRAGDVIVFHANVFHSFGTNMYPPFDRRVAFISYNSVANVPRPTRPARPEFLCAQHDSRCGPATTRPSRNPHDRGGSTPRVGLHDTKDDSWLTLTPDRTTRCFAASLTFDAPTGVSAWSQPLWTLLTGKPLRHEAPRWRVQPATALVLTAAAIVLLAAAQLALLSADAFAWRALGWTLVAPAALVMAGLWRSIQVVFGHHAIHATLLAGGDDPNRLMARLLTVFSLCQSETEYEREHLDHHRRAVFTTLQDADANLLYRCGLRPGLSEGLLRRRLLLTLFSPRFHAWFMAARIGSNLRRPFAWRCLALLWIALVFVGAPLALGVVRRVVGPVAPAGAGVSDECAAAVLDRACLAAIAHRIALHVQLRPPLPRPILRRRGAWPRWPACQPASVVALVAPHVVPSRPDARLRAGRRPAGARFRHDLCSLLRQDPGTWPSAIYERQRAVDSGHDAGMRSREIWGLDHMVTHVLRHLSEAAPFPQEGTPWPQAGQGGLRPAAQKP